MRMRITRLIATLMLSLSRPSQGAWGVVVIVWLHKLILGVSSKLLVYFISKLKLTNTYHIKTQCHIRKITKSAYLLVN